MTHAAAVHHTSTGLDSRKMAFWAFIGSECLLFGSLISTYLIYKGKSVVGPYPHDVLNIPFTSVSTFDLLMSSLMMVLAPPAGPRGDLKWAESGEHAHPNVGTYLRVAAILVILTVLEVGVFYVPAFHAVLVPTLLALSAVKFALVVLFYMHLRMDSRFFSFLFGGPLLLAMVVLVALLFLFFGQFTLRGAGGAGAGVGGG